MSDDLGFDRAGAVCHSTCSALPLASFTLSLPDLTLVYGRTRKYQGKGGCLVIPPKGKLPQISMREALTGHGTLPIDSDSMAGIILFLLAAPSTHPQDASSQDSYQVATLQGH